MTSGHLDLAVGLPARIVVEISSSNNRNLHIITAFRCTGGGVTEKAGGGWIAGPVSMPYAK